MKNKKMMQFIIELPFPENDISCQRCKLLAKSYVAKAHCIITGKPVEIDTGKRATECPLKPT